MRIARAAFVSFGLFAAVSVACAQDPYNEPPSYARSHDFDLQHLKLELSFDLPQQKLIGTATLKMAPLSGDLRELTLDSSGLEIESVTAAGHPLAFQAGADKLYVTLDKQYAAGTPVEFVVKYHAQPRRGLFFVFPDKFHPTRPKQIWANGDTAGGNNRFWFPGYDFPNDKTTTEMIVTVPAGWLALSNGELLGQTDNKGAGLTTFHWSQTKPMATYLVSLVAGEFDRVEDKWKVPVVNYVPHGRGGDAPRTFGRTTQMLDFFSDNIAPYPWAKYSQAMVDTFGGGMENTSATTEGAASILDARDFDDRKVGTDSLIAHEMAHQWFGDLVTCADWRHSWLNEGFATYFEALWQEHARGRDIFDWNELRAGRSIAAAHLPLAVVPHEGQDTLSAYSMIYNKGGWALHMVRGQLGDARFWKAIQHYVQKFSYQNATTADFVEAIAESSGQDLEWLFDQYVYRPGNPEFEVAWDYNTESRMLHINVKQTQKTDGKPTPFRAPIEIETLGDGAPQTFRLSASKESEDFSFLLTDRPRTVLFDPRDIILKSVDFKKPAVEWIWQLEHAARALNREEAAIALGGFGGSNVVTALERAGGSDAFYGVRVEAATALGRMKNDAARAALLKILGDKEAEVRAAAATSLGNQEQDPAVVAKLFEVAKNDSSFAVRRSTLAAVVRWKPENGVDALKPFLNVESPDDQIRAAAITAMSALGDDSIAPTLLQFSQDKNDNVRRAALRAFATVGRTNQEVSDRLIEALSGDKGDKQSAIFSLQYRRDAAAVGPLEQLAAAESLPAIARAARNAAQIIRTPPGAASSPEVTALRDRMAALEKENTDLKARLERLEKK